MLIHEDSNKTTVMDTVVGDGLTRNDKKGTKDGPFNSRTKIGLEQRCNRTCKTNKNQQIVANEGPVNVHVSKLDIN